ncbi:MULTISPECIES: PadR family transcriptional regulator [Thermocrispum]|uniref:PadR family transcriptional regulator n=1 Tax=Thermocrispum agreste TaxID=37925 RepID=A0ABD6F9Z9_9PSEU|nr:MULTISPECIES: PadR family transcriptional regulator [Thermocrispum]
MTDLNATSAAVLGLLHDGPATGGELVAAARQRYGAFFSVTRSQVYRELPELARAGLVRPGKRGARASQQYVLTPAGRTAFKQWLKSAAAADHLRSTMLLRLVNAHRLTGRQRAAVVDEVRAHYQEAIAQAKSAARTARATGDETARAVAAFAQAHANAALKLVDALSSSPPVASATSR